jgi:hypothetical protein
MLVEPDTGQVERECRRELRHEGRIVGQGSGQIADFFRMVSVMRRRPRPIQGERLSFTPHRKPQRDDAGKSNGNVTSCVRIASRFALGVVPD